MGWSERHDDFERLIALRDGYAARVDEHVAVLSMADAMRYAEAILTAVEIDVEPWLVELDEAFGDEPSAAGDASAATAPSSIERPTPWPWFATELWPWPSPGAESARPSEPDRD
jgi:hypothetical protein